MQIMYRYRESEKSKWPVFESRVKAWIWPIVRGGKDDFFGWVTMLDTPCCSYRNSGLQVLNSVPFAPHIMFLAMALVLEASCIYWPVEYRAWSPKCLIDMPNQEMSKIKICIVQVATTTSYIPYIIYLRNTLKLYYKYIHY